MGKMDLAWEISCGDSGVSMGEPAPYEAAFNNDWASEQQLALLLDGLETAARTPEDLPSSNGADGGLPADWPEDSAPDIPSEWRSDAALSLFTFPKPPGLVSEPVEQDPLAWLDAHFAPDSPPSLSDGPVSPDEWLKLSGEPPMTPDEWPDELRALLGTSADTTDAWPDEWLTQPDKPPEPSFTWSDELRELTDGFLTPFDERSNQVLRLPGAPAGSFPQCPGDLLRMPDTPPDLSLDWPDESQEISEDLRQPPDECRALPEDQPLFFDAPHKPSDEWRALLDKWPELFSEPDTPPEPEPRPRTFRKVHEKKKKPFFKAILGVLFPFAAVCVLLAVFGLGMSGGESRQFFGYTCFTASASRAGIPRDALILAKKAAEPSIRLGDSIAYRRADNTLDTRRVFAIINTASGGGQPVFQLAQDTGLPTPEAGAVNARNVVGKVKLVSAALGRALTYISRHLAAALVLLCASAAGFVWPRLFPVRRGKSHVRLLTK